MGTLIFLIVVFGLIYLAFKGLKNNARKIRAEAEDRENLLDSLSQQDRAQYLLNEKILSEQKKQTQALQKAARFQEMQARQAKKKRK